MRGGEGGLRWFVVAVVAAVAVVDGMQAAIFNSARRGESMALEADSTFQIRMAQAAGEGAHGIATRNNGEGVSKGRDAEDTAPRGSDGGFFPRPAGGRRCG